MHRSDETSDGEDGERGWLRARLPERPVPERLEWRVAASLTGHGLLGRRPSARRSAAWGRVLLASAASLMFFAAGTWTGHRVSARTDREASVSPRFLLLLYSDATAPSADERADVAAMRQWARDLRSRGHYVTGARLARDGIPVGRADGAGPALAGDGGDVLLSGFFIITEK